MRAVDERRVTRVMWRRRWRRLTTATVASLMSTSLWYFCVDKWTFLKTNGASTWKLWNFKKLDSEKQCYKTSFPLTMTIKTSLSLHSAFPVTVILTSFSSWLKKCRGTDSPICRRKSRPTRLTQMAGTWSLESNCNLSALLMYEACLRAHDSFSTA